MSDNYYIDEIRETRDRIARSCNYDPKKILERVRDTVRKLSEAARLDYAQA